MSDGRAGHENNLYGTMEEDAERRDFTMNALYYSPVGKQVIDYVGGYADIKARRIRTLLPAETSFAEDPVRMIRAVKYACLADFPLPQGMAVLIRRQRASILSCSRERVTEEIYKILTSGKAAGILELAERMQLFSAIFPALDASFRAARVRFADTPLAGRLRVLDERAEGGRLLAREGMFELLFRDLAIARDEVREEVDPVPFLQRFLRECSQPLFPSKKDIGVAADAVLREARPHYRPPATSPARRRRHSAGAPAGEVRDAGTAPYPPRRRRRRRGRGRGGAPRHP
jgi:poly(A) polymerase